MNPDPALEKTCGEEPAKKKFKHSTISERLNARDFQDLFSDHWRNRKPLDVEDLCVIVEPYRLCRISNFIRCEAFMEDLKAELAEVKSRRQSIDLYQFEQTSDLADVDSPNLRRLWETFQSDFADWMKKNSGVELNKKISMSSSVYYDTDYLLCHDDNMGDRRIAFVLYLSKDWSAEDGGTLDLFDTDENGAPGKIVRSLVPEYNSLIFFEVNERSYHQVSEVKSVEKSRWTINGWLHGPLAHEPRKQRAEIQYSLVSPSASSDADLRSWIRNCYLDAGIAKNVQKNVEVNSYTFLSNFFIGEVYERLARDVTSKEIVWKRVGPPDARNYEIAEMDSLPQKLAEFYGLFGNIEIFRLLKEYTELDLVPGVREEGDPKMRIELQRWSSGCYTLMCDKTSSGDEDRDRRSEGETVASMSEITKIASMNEDDDVPTMEELMELALRSEEGRMPSLRQERRNGNSLAAPSEEMKKSEKKKQGEAALDGEESDAPRCEEGSESPRSAGRRAAALDERAKDPAKSEERLAARHLEKPASRIKLTDKGGRQEDKRGAQDEKKIDSPHAVGTDESGDSVILKGLLRGKSRSDKKFLLAQQASCSSIDEKSLANFTRESDDSDVSDIGDYLSDRFERSIENSDEEDDEDEDEEEEEDRAASPSVVEPGSLDVIIQFNTSEAPSEETIDYIDPNQQEGALIHVPFKDNHLCLVYKTIRTTRLHKYVNHYCKGYFYNLICTYYE